MGFFQTRGQAPPTPSPPVDISEYMCVKSLDIFKETLGHSQVGLVETNKVNQNIFF